MCGTFIWGHSQSQHAGTCGALPFHSRSDVAVLQNGWTALHTAASWANLASLQALLAAGASYTAADNAGKTPMHLAATARVEAVKEHLRLAVQEGQAEHSRVVEEPMCVVVLPHHAFGVFCRGCGCLFCLHAHHAFAVAGRTAGDMGALAALVS